LVKLGNTVLVQRGAGVESGYTDDSYMQAGAELADSRSDIFGRADILVQIQAYGCNHNYADADLSLFRAGQVVIGLMDPLGQPGKANDLAEAGVTAMALELVPRISRAQSMDVLTSMATIAGYKSVLIGASTLGSLMPLMMTAAGTLKPARAFIMGAGVAGLQAAAMAKRLGAVVEAYDVRPAAQEQIISVGAKPIQLELPAEEAEGQGGYAKAQGEEFLQDQRRQMAGVLSQQDLVITTAAIPGVKSPILITAEMVQQMKPGAVIVDLAAERGGNCELTQLDKTVIENGVTILGPDNIPSTVAHHASQMYGRNVENLLMHIVDDQGVLKLDFEDEIIVETVMVHESKVIHPRIKKLLGLDQESTS
jgi:proton-translocating NAD(P)+ transhydrogenase subunit alpha